MTDLALLNECHARIDQLWREIKRLRRQNWQLVAFLHDRVIQYVDVEIEQNQGKLPLNIPAPPLILTPVKKSQGSTVPPSEGGTEHIVPIAVPPISPARSPPSARDEIEQNHISAENSEEVYF